MKTKSKPWNGLLKVRTKIIENVWLKMKIELQKISKTVDFRDQLYDKISKKWTNISVNYIRNLYSSIPKRICKVQTAQGYITKYYGKSIQFVYFFTFWVCMSFKADIKEFLFPVYTIWNVHSDKFTRRLYEGDETWRHYCSITFFHALYISKNMLHSMEWWWCNLFVLDQHA
jgi:hypothetical protein